MHQAETRTMNLALLRVCSIILVVNGLNGLVSALWRQFSIGQTDGTYFYVTVSVISVVVGLIALVKKSAWLLKIYALLVILLVLQQISGVLNIGSYFTTSLDSRNVVKMMSNIFLSFNTLFIVTVFLVDYGQGKRLDKEQSLNLGLLRFCAAFFILRGLNEIITVSFDMSAMDMSNLERSLSWIAIALGGISVGVGVLSLAIKRAIVLKVYAIIAIIRLLWNMVEYKASFEIVVNVVFNALFVILYATFLIESKKHPAPPEVENSPL